MDRKPSGHEGEERGSPDHIFLLPPVSALSAHPPPYIRGASGPGFHSDTTMSDTVLSSPAAGESMAHPSTHNMPSSLPAALSPSSGNVEPIPSVNSSSSAISGDCFGEQLVSAPRHTQLSLLPHAQTEFLPTSVLGLAWAISHTAPHSAPPSVSSTTNSGLEPYSLTPLNAALVDHRTSQPAPFHTAAVNSHEYPSVASSEHGAPLIGSVPDAFGPTMVVRPSSGIFRPLADGDLEGNGPMLHTRQGPTPPDTSVHSIDPFDNPRAWWDSLSEAAQAHIVAYMDEHDQSSA